MPMPVAAEEVAPPGLAAPPGAGANGEGGVVDDFLPPTVSASATSDAAAAMDDAAAAVPTGAVVDVAADAAAAEDMASTVPKSDVPAPIVASAGPVGGSVGPKKAFAALFTSGSGSSSVVRNPTAPPPSAVAPVPAPRRPVAPAAAPAVAATNGGGQAPEASQPAVAAPASTATSEQDVPDNQQVFVGNIRPDMSEADLAAVFGKFGHVVGCRITYGRSKPGMQASCFGFVSFSTPEPARALIETKVSDVWVGSSWVGSTAASSMRSPGANPSATNLI